MWTHSKLASLCCAGLLFTEPSFAQLLELKGLRIGMSLDEAEYQSGNKFSPPPSPGSRWRFSYFRSSIAGINSQMTVTTRDDRVISVHAYIPAGNFEDLREALKSKYPKLSCGSGPIVLLGVRTQTKSCDLESGGSVLLLQEKFSGPFEGQVLLRSKADIDEEVKQRKREAKNI